MTKKSPKPQKRTGSIANIPKEKKKGYFPPSSNIEPVKTSEEEKVVVRKKIKIPTINNYIPDWA